jgi:hypothetical protein
MLPGTRFLVVDQLFFFIRVAHFAPRTAIAFTPLPPITAPPPRRLALDLPCSMEAVKTRFSSSRPMAATWAFG